MPDRDKGDRQPEPLVVAEPVSAQDDLTADEIDQGFIAERVVYVEIFPL